MTWSTLGGSRYYEQLKIVDDMNNSESWAKGSKYNEKLKVVFDMNDFGSPAEGFRCYE